MSFRLCSVAPSQRGASGRSAPARRRHRDRELVAQVLRGQRARLVHQLVERAREDHASALLAGAEPESTMWSATRIMSASCSTTSTVLPWSRSCRRMRDQPLVVARVQADRRLVEHVERADQRRAERRREVDALRFAARERRRQPVERQVVEADVAQEAEPLAGSRAAPCRRSPSPSPTARASAKNASRVAHRQRRTRRRSCGRRPARRAPRAAAARRRSPGTSGSRGSGSGTRGRGPCISSARASGRSP